MELNRPVEGGHVEMAVFDRFFVFPFGGVIEDLGEDQIWLQLPESHVDLVHLFRRHWLIVLVETLDAQMELGNLVFVLVK